MTEVKRLLVPGGLGFIGSHTVVHIIQQTQAKVAIIDDLSNCFTDVLSRIKIILSRNFTQVEIDERIKFHQGNILNLPFLEEVFKIYK